MMSLFDQPLGMAILMLQADQALDDRPRNLANVQTATTHRFKIRKCTLLFRSSKCTLSRDAIDDPVPSSIIVSSRLFGL
jgi:hypothetical protein